MKLLEKLQKEVEKDVEEDNEIDCFYVNLKIIDPVDSEEDVHILIVPAPMKANCIYHKWYDYPYVDMCREFLETSQKCSIIMKTKTHESAKEYMIEMIEEAYKSGKQIDEWYKISADGISRFTINP